MEGVVIIARSRAFIADLLPVLLPTELALLPATPFALVALGSNPHQRDAAAGALDGTHVELYGTVRAVGPTVTPHRFACRRGHTWVRY